MSDLRDQVPESMPTRRVFPWRQAWLTVAAVFLLLATVWGVQVYYAGRIGPEQPIPFSHRVHAGDKKISCVFCHDGALSGARSGVPPLETCMLCHERIIIKFPPIKKLREHYYGGEPVEWVRVNQLPDFVYFDHSVHIHAQIDCGQCHGPVNQMDRIELYRNFEMGFCVQCHRDNNVTHDCLACHR